MNSRIAYAIGLKTHPVALVWANQPPEKAACFTEGRWGCVMGMIAATADKGRVSVFGRKTYGCWGGGVGLGFGNCYETFPGGVDGFCGFLAHGNNTTEAGREIGDQIAASNGRHMANEFLQGERYLVNADATRRFLGVLPMRDIPAEYVVIKPLDDAEPGKDDIKSVTFFVNADQLSALVILANYTDPENDNVLLPWAAGCQQIGIFAYRELESERPRAIVGLTDISARQKVSPSLGSNVMSFTALWPVFQKMEENVDGSFLQRDVWRAIAEG